MNKKRHDLYNAILARACAVALALVVLALSLAPQAAEAADPVLPVRLGLPSLAVQGEVRHMEQADSPDRVVAHYGAAGLGQPGVVVLGAYSWSVSEGALFGRLTEMAAGQWVFVIGQDARLYRYQVVRAYYLPQADWWQVFYFRKHEGWSVTPPNGEQVLRIMTCWGNGYRVVEAAR